MPGKKYAARFMGPLLLVFWISGAIAAETTRDRGISVQPRFKTAAHFSISRPQHSASYALIIGIDEYTQGWPKLKNAVKDAELIAGEMSRRGFQVTLSKNPNSKHLKQSLEQFFAVKGADPKARLFVWYAGHGHTLQGEAYLVPADAPIPNNGPDWVDRNVVDFKLKALNMRRFGEYVRLAATPQSYTIFDSCFGGKIFGTETPLARLTDEPVPIGQFLTAGTASQKVADDGGFRRLFIRALNGATSTGSNADRNADRNNDGFLTAGELGEFMTTRYGQLTQGRQTPRSSRQNPSAFAFKIIPTPPRRFVSVQPVDVWTYDKGTFEQIVFDWPRAVSYKMSRHGNRTQLIFKAPASIKIAPLRGEKLRNVSSAKIHRKASETVLTLDIPADRYVHHYVDGNRITLDVVNPQIVTAEPNPIQLASYPAPARRVGTRSLPDIITRTARIFQMLQPRPQSRVRVVRQRTQWRQKPRHRRGYRRHRR